MALALAAAAEARGVLIPRDRIYADAAGLTTVSGSGDFTCAEDKVVRRETGRGKGDLLVPSSECTSDLSVEDPGEVMCAAEAREAAGEDGIDDGTGFFSV